MNSNLIKRIAAKVMVDYQRLSIVNNPDGLLTQEAVRSLLFQNYGVEVIVGSNLQLRIHFELIFKVNSDRRFLYVSEDTTSILPDMRQQAYVCTFNISDAFPLFADKSLLHGLPFEVLDKLYPLTTTRRVTMSECSFLVERLIVEREQELKQSADYCLARLRNIEVDWTKPQSMMETISNITIDAVKNGVYHQIIPGIDAINHSFQKWVDENYFATLQSNHLIHPKSVNKILPHLVIQHDREDKVALLVVDGFTYWQYTILRQFLETKGVKTEDGTTLSWLPSITMLSRQAIFRGGVPQPDYKQNPTNEGKLWMDYWKQQGFGSHELQYISDKDEFAINEGVKRLAVVTVEMDEKMHSSSDNKDLLSLTENWCPRITEKIMAILRLGYHLYLTTDHGSVLSYGWRPLTQIEMVFLYKDGSRGKRHLIYNNKDEQARFYKENKDLSLLNHDNWLAIRDDSCFAREGSAMITHGGSHFTEVVIPFVKLKIDK